MVSLSVSNLSKSFRVKDKNIQVLSDISINFPDNGIVGLLGKNGAGKTTFIKSCVNLISYDGIIKYYGEDLQILYKKVFIPITLLLYLKVIEIYIGNLHLLKILSILQV